MVDNSNYDCFKNVFDAIVRKYSNICEYSGPVIRKIHAHDRPSSTLTVITEYFLTPMGFVFITVDFREHFRL